LWVPDEEIGGHDGMELLIKTDFWKNLNIGFALDEGLANPGPEYMLYYSERLPWWFEITVKGQPGHGSQFLQDTVGEKLNKVVQKFMEFRQGRILNDNCSKNFERKSFTLVLISWLKYGTEKACPEKPV
jgi:aminoacylase